eukprot:TRINITY_DN34215_c0_g1_i1.p2 TRINITY_DN34215_c0_g1~~TRINITY_DN34215_c0_g1_i1.p2  ORF type:complete len:222 (+),score=34.78 TRINITY_DN34215_c0_g1_i1:41-667(+)
MGCSASTMVLDKVRPGSDGQQKSAAFPMVLKRVGILSKSQDKVFKRRSAKIASLHRAVDAIQQWEAFCWRRYNHWALALRPTAACEPIMVTKQVLMKSKRCDEDVVVKPEQFFVVIELCTGQHAIHGDVMFPVIGVFPLFEHTRPEVVPLGFTGDLSLTPRVLRATPTIVNDLTRSSGNVVVCQAFVRQLGRHLQLESKALARLKDKE